MELKRFVRRYRRPDRDCTHDIVSRWGFPEIRLTGPALEESRRLEGRRCESAVAKYTKYKVNPLAP
jgi:hypothetical protein